MQHYFFRLGPTSVKSYILICTYDTTELKIHLLRTYFICCAGCIRGRLTFSRPVLFPEFRPTFNVYRGTQLVGKLFPIYHNIVSSVKTSSFSTVSCSDKNSLWRIHIKIVSRVILLEINQAYFLCWQESMITSLMCFYQFSFEWTCIRTVWECVSRIYWNPELNIKVP